MDLEKDEKNRGGKTVIKSKKYDGIEHLYKLKILQTSTLCMKTCKQMDTH